MAKQTGKKLAAEERPTSKSRTLGAITGSDALAILKVLADRHENLAREIDAVAQELLSPVEINEVAVEVQMELEFLQVEDVWDQSGATRDGYLEPDDVAWEMFEEALRPFREEVEKYRQLSMLEEAESTCQGLLKGIYQFDKESATEYKEWAVDAPSEYFGNILDEWRKLSGGQTTLLAMKEFLHTHCPDWAAWAVRSLRGPRP